MKNLPKNENIYIYGKKLYIDYFTKEKRVRKSTGLNNSSLAFAFVKKHYHHFLNPNQNIKELQKQYYELENQDTENKLIKQTNKRINKANPHQKIQKDLIEYTFYKITENILKEKSFLKRNTNNTYSSLRNIVLNFLEKNKLFYVSDFKREHSLLFLKDLQEQKLQPKTIRSLCFFMKSIFNYALNNDMILKNPFFTPKMKENLDIVKQDFKVFNFDEMVNLIKHSKGDLRLFLILAFFTGARTGEILALKYEDLDFHHNEIHIFKSLSHNGLMDSPKTKSSKRIIDMLELIKQEFLPLREKHSLGDFVIKSPRRSLTKEFHSLLENLNYEKRRLYDTRHSFASLMLSKGEEPMWVGCKMMGHKDLNETYRSYAKYLPKEVVERATFLKNLDLSSSSFDIEKENC